MKRSFQGPALRGARQACFVASTLALGCSSDAAPKAWNALSACLAGKSAQGPALERVQQLRLIQLANAGTPAKADGWTARCGAYADELYAALPTSGNGSMLRRKLEERLGCKEDKGSCKLVGDASVLSISGELWDTAKDSGLSTTETPANVPLPEAAPPPVVDAKTWKSFSAKPMKLAGPVQTGAGRAVVLLKPAEGRARPTACEFSDGFGKLRCVEANPKMPELPAHTLDVVNDATGLYAAGLTETGLVAYNLETGEQSDVRGRARRLVRDGVAVEPGTKQDVSQAPPAAGAAPNVKEEGFVAVPLKAGKASKEMKLNIENGVGDPISFGKHVFYLTQTGSGAELHVKQLAQGRLKDQARVAGPFAGAFHTCSHGDQVAVATWSGRSGLSGAKATGGAGKTQVAVALYRDGRWSKALEATIPFERAFESELVCSAAGASLAWAQNGDGGAQLGRVDCTPEGCKSADVKLAGVESKWWWAVVPFGQKTLVLYRSGLGETRLRLAGLSELPTTKDTVLFDSPDFGGPNAGELTSIVDDNAALLVFRGEQPVALHVGANGSPRVLSL
jgi:hypothetical protein